MKRRMWILVLVLVMALSALPVSAGAKAEDAATQLYNKTRRSYTSSLASYGKSSFYGYCATLVAYQLRYNGITKYAELCNGNEMYDRYKNKTRSAGGYYIHPYSAKEYSLEETLNVISENGSKDVYNILVGFQWTNTAAGGKYGHTVFINGIVDGTVYFTESFDSATIGKEGTVGQVSIAKFAKMYGSWTRYEGCIYFTKDYAESLQRWDTNLFVRTRFDVQLRSQPCLVGEKECQLLRSVTAGERLLVTALLQSRENEWYYEVCDGAYTGYIVAQAAVPEQNVGENVGVRDLMIPQSIAQDQTLNLTGTAYSGHGRIRTVEAVVTDASGVAVYRAEETVGKRTWSLDSLVLPVFPEGGYHLTVTATVETPYLVEERLEEGTVVVQLVNAPFWVGPMIRMDHVRSAPVVTPKPDGWSRQDGTWYYYEGGQPYAGWLWEHGIRYYLDETGAVTTGWATIDGQTCLFSDNGALCTGWIREDAGMRYCSAAGRFVNGWVNIDGVRYYFEEGIMQTSGTHTDGVEVYRLEPDGKAVVLTEE